MTSVRHVGIDNKDYSPERSALEMKDLFEQILSTLKKIEYHLCLVTDADLTIGEN